MSDILVTGGYGLIGHNVVRKLKDLRHRVCVVDTETNYGIIPQDEIDYLMAQRKKVTGAVEHFPHDISDRFLVNKPFRLFQPDIVIHMASGEYPLRFLNSFTVVKTAFSRRIISPGIDCLLSDLTLSPLLNIN